LVFAELLNGDSATALVPSRAFCPHKQQREFRAKRPTEKGFPALMGKNSDNAIDRERTELTDG
jgi:hypothetical protein